MKGSIRVAIGFLIVFGSVGGMDADPSASILLGLATAVLGLCLMYSGVTAMNRDNNHG
jgi:hypothetical protein